MPVQRVEEILKIAMDPISLETPVGEEDDTHLGDFIKDNKSEVPADAAAYTLLQEQLDEVMQTLTDREKKVLALRFGLEDGRSRTLGSRKRVPCHKGTHPADRGEGFAETAASEPQPEIKRLS